jgi:hypothetical protein
MTINFNHTTVWARDSEASATFLSQILGLPAPQRWGPFLVVKTGNDINVDFMNTDGEITPQHYAFLVSEPEFDEIFGRVRERSLPYASPPREVSNESKVGRPQIGLIQNRRRHRGLPPRLRSNAFATAQAE